MEEEKIREKIARYEFSNILNAGFPSHAGIPFEKLPDDWWSKVEAYERADQILSLEVYKGCTIRDLILRGRLECENQNLPEIPEFQYDDPEKREWLKRGAINYSKLLSDWVKCLPK